MRRYLAWNRSGRRTYSYDALGRPAKTTNALGNTMAGSYDLAGRLTEVQSLNNTGATVRAVGLGYDAAGNPIRHTSGEGHVTRYTYDATNLLTQMVEPVSADESITTSFGYDAAGARTRVTDGRGNATWTGYNTLGLIETLTEPATAAHPDVADRTWTHVYDANGNETALIQPGGVQHDKEYDNLNRLTKVSGSGAGIVATDKTYGYDLADRPTKVSDQTLEYNDRGLLTKLTPPTGTATTFAYDAVGNPTQRVDITGTTTYTWDADDRLKTVTDPVSGRTNTYAYDRADRLTTITSANPVNTQAFTYDALDRVDTHTLKDSSGGQLSKITYGWDKDDNLTSKVTEGLAGAGSNTYGYDHAGRLTSWTGPDGTTTAYEWDASGNRTKAGNKTYTYDERNRLTEGDGSTYTYTPRGTLATQTKNGVTRNLTFDAFDRLINDGDATYTYDAFDRMATRQRSGAAQQHFAYAGLDNDIIAITDQTGAVQASYGRDPFGGLISIKEGTTPATGALTDLHHDLVGTFTGTALSSTTTYNPFGEVTAETGTKPALGYQSEYTDPDTGNVNMHARWYQPGIGTFISRDSWTLPPIPSIHNNRYAYGNGSPLRYTDPNGHASIPLDCVTRAWWFIPLCVVFTPDPLEGEGSGGACKDKWGRTASCNPPPAPGKCAEFANACRKDGANKTSPPKKKGEKKRGNPTVPPVVPVPPPVPPLAPVPPTKGPRGTGKKDNGPTYRWVNVKRPDCKTCFEEGELSIEEKCPLAPGAPCENPNRIQIGVDSLADLAGVESGLDSVTDSIITCDDAWNLTGLCIDGVGVVDAHQSTDTDYGDPPPPTIFSCDGPPNSFTSGTEVLMAGGSTKPIEAINIGDMVVASDPDTGRTAARPVTALIDGIGTKRLVEITVETDGGVSGPTGTITATDNHPFWVPALHLWVDAGSLQPGMWLQTAAGTYVQVAAVQAWTTVERVHNLTVDDLHTYHVVAGSASVLVHNVDDPGCDDLPPYVPGRGTSGRGKAADGSRTYDLRSGDKKRDADLISWVNNRLRETGHIKGAYTSWRASDVEQKMVAIMARDGIKKADLEINNPNGPCSIPLGCDRVLDDLLGENELTVRWPGGPPGGKTYGGR
ncbi:polymorphic toxin-type HINT domain-containing protein [Nonomuraea sp. NPDC049421]|uniref:polymorphic toxin-type HINT domain-containing protein n=1 Tax=Nonomuraea sp. NPDC049421 TaxID=3155275 RepID=UPI0034160930